MEKRVSFESQFAKLLSSKLQSFRADSIIIQEGFYCNRDPRAFLYYLQRYLREEGKTGFTSTPNSKSPSWRNRPVGERVKFEFKKLSEDFCWQHCFRGFANNGELPQCKNCIKAVIQSNQEGGLKKCDEFLQR